MILVVGKSICVVRIYIGAFNITVVTQSVLELLKSLSYKTVMLN